MDQLINIQNELKVPKGNLNKFGNYKYRSAEDILEAVKPILSKYKAFCTLNDEIVQVGSKMFLKAIATIYIGEQALSTTGFAELSEHKGMSAEQCTGTASSYARKYALNGLFLIDETEQDADNDNKNVKEHELKTDATKAVPLSDKAFTAMCDAIAKGQKEKVKEAMNKYTLLKPQLDELNKLLNNA